MPLHETGVKLSLPLESNFTNSLNIKANAS